jgi:glycosyltransferase involved in cell wall biosynthesis/SAM-dependent methyltransferase
LAAEDDYELREQQLMERIQNVDPAWLEEDSIPQSIQFMIELLPTIRTLLKGWPTWKTLSVLDVGAASGAGSNLLATMYREHFFDVKMKVDALDIEPKFKTYADSRFPNIRYMIGDIYKLDNTNVWDLIVCSHTLEHIPDYRRFLTELQRRARYWVLVYVPYEEKSLIAIHQNSFTEKTVRSLDPIILQVLESPAWKAPVEKKGAVRKCILFVMKGFASREPITQSPEAQDRIKVIQKLVDVKDYDKAIIGIEELIKNWPMDGRLNYLLGFCAQTLNKDSKKSLAHYDLALKYGYDEFWVKYHRGILYMKLGELQKASLDLERALALKPWDDGTKLVLKEIERKRLENEKRDESQNTKLGLEKTMEEKDNQIMQVSESNKAVDNQLKQAIKEVDTLQDINLGLQKTIEEKDNQIMQVSESNKALETELKRVITEVDTLQNIDLGQQKTIENNQKSIDVLQNINLGQQKTIEEKDNQIMQVSESIKIIDTQLKQVIKEVDTLQNINLGQQKTIESNQKSIDVLQNTNLGHLKTIESNQKSIHVLQNINLGQQKTIEEKDNQIMQVSELSKAVDNQLKQAIKEVDTLQNIDLGQQKTIENNQKSIDVLQNINLGQQKIIENNQKSIDVLQNTNLGHQKTIEEKDNHIIQLNESNKSLEIELKRILTEFDTLQNINSIHQKNIEDKQSEIKQLNESSNAVDNQLKQAIKEFDTLQNIDLGQQKTIENNQKSIDVLQNTNLGHQKTIEEKDNHIIQLNESSNAVDNQLKHAVKDVDTLQNINLGHQKTIEEKDNNIMQLNELNKATDMELSKLRSTIFAIQNSIAWRTLTPLKIRYDAIFHRVNNNNKTKSPPLQTTATAASLIQTTTGEQIDKPIVPQRLKDKRDIICFPITDWSFRYQRSNHLLSKFANNGHRIFYLTVNLYPEKTPYSITNIAENIFEIKLNCVSHFNIYNDVLDKGITESLLLSSQKMQEDLEISALSYIAFPSWARLVLALKEKYGWPIIYDCLDDYYGFGNVNKARIDEEIKLFRNSDLVLTTSSFLYKKARRVTNKTLYIPNAGEFDHFKQPPQNDLLKNIKKPIAGYYGAIADWFDNETIEYVAIRKPDVNFVFIGHTFGSNISTLEKLSNVHFLGEKPYRELPLYLYHFDVCLIPFKPTPLIEATHPVKFYEYLASGKPVISTRLSELFPFGNLCYLSSDKEEFLINLDRALNENDPQMVSRRIEFASKNTWEHRFGFLYPEMKTILSSE